MKLSNLLRRWRGMADDPKPLGEMPAAYEHLERFQALADQHGDRATGTSGYEAAAQYVEEQLAGAGYQSIRQYFTFKHRGGTVETFNIIAETEAGSADSVIMLGAHLDGVPGAPAINDNASGAAALLVAATVLGREGRINNKVRFAWWGAEEFSKSYGSRHYVRDLAKNNSGELANISAYLNFDMIASPNPVIGVYDARDPEPIHAVTGGSEEIMGVFTDYFDSLGQPWIATDWDYDSDQIAFVKKGVAAGGLYSGDSDKKTTREAQLFGGRAKRPCDPNYHQPGDDIRNVDVEALRLMTDAIVHVASRLAEDNSVLQVTLQP
ncbi:M28 family peptidase [Citricoccus alkalitolerans]|uniref:M28 family peptidase n=1 Tax=Citricoccus alkalitolerans TaxID=246603 RepID=A0ABV8XXE5_9MICC